MRNLLHQLTRLTLNEGELVLIRASLNSDIDWSAFLRESELAAISPLIYAHAEKYQLAFPSTVLLSLKALVMRHRAAANSRYELMQQLVPAFAQADIPLVALKGLALAPMLYPKDEARPMRDIDVLVPAEHEAAAGELLQKLGFDLPEAQASKFMRDSHQLPNATKTINGFLISVEIHHDALSRDVPEHLTFEDIKHSLQFTPWRELTLCTLGHELMLHQVARHLAGLHPGAVLKLINVLDVVMYAEKFQDEIDWGKLARNYSHVLNTLKCLHYIVPLTSSLQAKVGGVSAKPLAGVGETMMPLTMITGSNASLRQKYRWLMSPPDWWLHLYYNVAPQHTLLWVKFFRHPLTLAHWMLKRLWSGLLGG